SGECHLYFRLFIFLIYYNSEEITVSETPFFYQVHKHRSNYYSYYSYTKSLQVADMLLCRITDDVVNSKQDKRVIEINAQGLFVYKQNELILKPLLWSHIQQHKQNTTGVK